MRRPTIGEGTILAALLTIAIVAVLSSDSTEEPDHAEPTANPSGTIASPAALPSPSTTASVVSAAPTTSVTAVLSNLVAQIEKNPLDYGKLRDDLASPVTPLDVLPRVENLLSNTTALESNLRRVVAAIHAERKSILTVPDDPNVRYEVRVATALLARDLDANLRWIAVLAPGHAMPEVMPPTGVDPSSVAGYPETTSIPVLFFRVLPEAKWKSYEELKKNPELRCGIVNADITLFCNLSEVFRAPSDSLPVIRVRKLLAISLLTLYLVPTIQSTMKLHASLTSLLGGLRIGASTGEIRYRVWTGDLAREVWKEPFHDAGQAELDLSNLVVTIRSILPAFCSAPDPTTGNTQ